jgi:hypothetical protein
MNIISRLYNKIIFFFKKKILFLTLNRFLENFHSKTFDTKNIVLIWDFGGFEKIFIKDLIIGLALKFRGHKPHHVICDGTPVACMQRSIEDFKNVQDWKSKCLKCVYKMTSCAKLYHGNYSFSSE